MRVEASSIGPIGKRCLQQPGTATVIATFDRSCYLDTGDGLICIAADSLYDGPLNVLIRSQGSIFAACRLFGQCSLHQRWALSPNALRCLDENGPVIDVSRALPWRPRVPRALRAGSSNQHQVIDGLNRLKELAQSRLPAQGLSRLALHGETRPRDAIERAAWPSLQTLHGHDWRRDDAEGLVSSLHDLLGLGPGLTPSGDDLIAGMLIACHQVGWGDIALNLWGRLENTARERTTGISFAHLAAAAEGLGAAPFHELLDAVTLNQRDNMVANLDAAAKIGHCSGWDAIGGLVLLLDAWISAGDRQSAAA